MYPGQEGVVLTEPAGQRLGQGRDLRTESAFGQVGQHRRVALTGDHRLEHRPPGHPVDVRSNRGQLHPSVLQQLLQPWDLPTAFAGDRGPGPSQVP